MSNALDCSPCCATPSVTAIPGIQGENSFTTTTASFVVPALGNQVTVSVVSTNFMAVGETLFIPGAGLFEVVNINSATSVLLEYLNISSNVNAAATIVSGSKVTPAGAPGTDGSNGGNSFTTTTAAFTVPAIGANVSAPDGFVHVASNLFLGVGQVVFISDGTDFGSFRVVSKPDAISFVATYLGFTGEAAPGAVIGSGATVSPGGSTLSTPLPIANGGTGSASVTAALAALGIAQAATIAYGAGTAYTLTATPALIAMGTTSPTITIPTTGVYKLTARVRVDYVAATFAAVQTLAFKLRRTAAVAGDVANATLGHRTEIITTLTYTAMNAELPAVYFSATAADVIQLWGSVSVIPSAGTIDVIECLISAEPLHLP